MVQHLLKRHNLEIPEELQDRVKTKRQKISSAPDISMMGGVLAKHPSSPQSASSLLCLSPPSAPIFSTLDFQIGPIVDLEHSGAMATGGGETELVMAVKAALDAATVLPLLENGADPNVVLVCSDFLFFEGVPADFDCC